MAKRKNVSKQLIIMIWSKKAYWLIPVVALVLVLILLATLVSFSGGAAAPFIYTIF